MNQHFNRPTNTVEGAKGEELKKINITDCTMGF